MTSGEPKEKCVVLGQHLTDIQQDELVRQFIAILEETKRLRIEVDNESLSVYQSYSLSEGVLGHAAVAGLILMPGDRTKMIMSLRIPVFEVEINGARTSTASAEALCLSVPSSSSRRWNARN